LEVEIFMGQEDRSLVLMDIKMPIMDTEEAMQYTAVLFI
jgi:CheY-like chemotaxis protein